MGRIRQDDLAINRRRARHKRETDANPVTKAEVDAWLLGLSGLNDAEGKEEQLRVCRELLKYAPEDEMLGSDAKIIKDSIIQLEEELSRETQPTARRRRPVAVVVDDEGDDESLVGPGAPDDSTDDYLDED